MIAHQSALAMALRAGMQSLIRKQKVWLMLALVACAPCAHAAFSLVLTNGYGDVYRMNLLRDRDNYQCYRGICSYRGFSLSGCSTTGEVVMLRIKETPSMPEHNSLLSTSLRWGTTTYVLNDLFHPLCSWVSSGYENWYPFDMSCSVAMYINSGGLVLSGPRLELVCGEQCFEMASGTPGRALQVELDRDFTIGDLAGRGLHVLLRGGRAQRQGG